jgi:hypothetical protein
MNPKHWHHPETLEELQNLPKDACFLSLWQIATLTSEDLFMIPKGVERLNIMKCNMIESLEALHHLVNLNCVWCNNCLNIRQDDVDKLRAREVLVDTGGCSQLRHMDVAMEKKLDIVGYDSFGNWVTF